AVRRQLGIERWVLEGYSGGSQLALTYALRSGDLPPHGHAVPDPAGAPTPRVRLDEGEDHARPVHHQPGRGSLPSARAHRPVARGRRSFRYFTFASLPDLAPTVEAPDSGDESRATH